MVDVGSGDDVAIHNRRRLAQMRIDFAECRQHGGQVKPGVIGNRCLIRDGLGETGGGHERQCACRGNALQSDIHASINP
jgi:hypothetical protein